MLSHQRRVFGKHIYYFKMKDEGDEMANLEHASVRISLSDLPGVVLMVTLRLL